MIDKLKWIQVISEAGVYLHHDHPLKTFHYVDVSAIRQWSLRQVTILFMYDRCPFAVVGNPRLQKRDVEDAFKYSRQLILTDL